MKSLGFLLIALCAMASAQECLPDNDRVDCHPDAGHTAERCLQRGCIECPASIPDQNTPSCFYPRDYGYKMVGEARDTGHGFQVQLERLNNPTMFGNDANILTLEADFQSDYRLRIRISDDSLMRWEVPLQVDPPASNATVNKLYDVVFVKEPVFSFKVIRRSTATVIFDSSLGGFVFSDQFIQIGFKLPSRNVYGIGENEQSSLRHTFEKRPKYPLWARDRAPSGNKNMYGVQPHYTVLEEDGNAHAVIIVNSNAQEWDLHPSPGIVYRTIGGILDMYFFMGPTPENTAQQYTEAVGRYPLPPYWSLGFQLCRYGYNNIETLKATVERNMGAGIPMDVQYGDIDIMDRNLDFTLSDQRFPGLNDYVKELRTRGVKFMTILDPCISAVEPRGEYKPYELGNEMDIWVTRADGVTPAQGKVWPDGACYFPDFAKNSTRDWWKLLIKEFHDDLLQFDAMWIDMNEPVSFVHGDLEEGCANNNLNEPPFLPKSMEGNGKIYEMTLCPDHLFSYSTHYNAHSLYGWFESEPTFEAVKAAVGKRTFALSRSTFLGSGRWVTHWLGDNFSRWSNLHHSIIGMLQFNLFGIPFVGPDICGHNGQATAELCGRWQELGAFYPFSRNHNANGQPDQDPAWFNGTIVEATKNSLRVRYTLLPYLYTLLAIHQLRGDTVARAMWGNFPNDLTARGVDRQFFWGSGVMITPVLDEGHVTVNGYFPDRPFYDYYTGEEVGVRGNWTVLDAPFDHINVHVSGGNIVPMQEPAVNTDISRNNPFGLIVALDDNDSAQGSFFFDDGDSFDTLQNGNYFWANMEISNKVLKYTVERNLYGEMADKKLNTVRLLGLESAPTRILLNGTAHSNFTVLPSKEVFIQGLDLNPTVNFELEYA